SQRATVADGTTSALLRGPDPRFGMQAPVAASWNKHTPAGRDLTVTTSRAVALATPGDPVTLASLTDTVQLNGRTYTSTDNSATRTIPERSPLLRTATTQIDAQGRPLSRATPGIDAVRSTYDARGRLTGLAQGSGPEERTLALQYGADGLVKTLTDP